MKDYKFTQTHEWLKSDDGEITIGITDHAQELLGDMVFVELPDIGSEFSAGDEMGVVESVKAASDFYAPIGGVITSVNEEVTANPALVNSDPYGAGWLVKIKPANPGEVDELLDASEYNELIAEEN